MASRGSYARCKPIDPMADNEPMANQGMTLGSQVTINFFCSNREIDGTAEAHGTSHTMVRTVLRQHQADLCRSSSFVLVLRCAISCLTLCHR